MNMWQNVVMVTTFMPQIPLVTFFYGVYILPIIIY